MELTEEYCRRAVEAEAGAAVAIDPYSKWNLLVHAAMWRRIADAAQAMELDPRGLNSLQLGEAR